MNSIIKKLTDKRILIFGYGREGKSTEEYIKGHVKYRALDIFEGKREDICEDDYDYIIKSPGIVMLEENPKYTSQTELFLDEFSGRTIGITGTKGKSTTSSMLAHTLNQIGNKAVLLGNIGKPCFDMIDEIDDDTWVVFELSCHQLLHINRAPHIAVFLNLFEEHLDYYKTMENYFSAKANIISHQTDDDICFVGENVPDIKHVSKMSVISKPTNDYKLSILGEHNKTNAEFVYQIVREIIDADETNGNVSDTAEKNGFSETSAANDSADDNNASKALSTEDIMTDAPFDSVMKAIQAFRGLPHRLEYFAEVDGVKFYDDSISTIPEACINAVKSVPNTATVIVGGMDRGIDYDILVDFIKETKDVLFILCYATGERIAKELLGDGLTNDAGTNVMLTDTLDSAVILAKEKTPSGKACILSPAAPSYGYFKNFEERGDYFKKIVM